MADELHSTPPTGYESEVCGLPTYIASPPSNNPVQGVLVIIPDIFGWVFSKTRALADAYAGKGNFLVYVPDFTKGKPFSL
jgi:dienelactone hydrolase